jgi:hypothetical protein
MARIPEGEAQTMRRRRDDPVLGRAYKSLVDRDADTVEKGLLGVILFVMLAFVIYGLGGSLVHWVVKGELPLESEHRQAAATATAVTTWFEARLALPRAAFERARQYLAVGDKERALEEAVLAESEFANVVRDAGDMEIRSTRALLEWGLAQEFLGDMRTRRHDYSSAEANLRQVVIWASIEHDHEAVEQAKAALSRMHDKLAPSE